MSMRFIQRHRLLAIGPSAALPGFRAPHFSTPLNGGKLERRPDWTGVFRTGRKNGLSGFTASVFITALAVVAAFLLAGAPAFAVTPPVNATLEPSQITLGESAQLTITSSGRGAELPKLPQVPGLELRIVGQSQRIQIINGAALASTSIMVRVTPQTAGVFTIPDVAPNSEWLVLRVTPPGGPAMSGKAGGSGAPGAGSSANGMRMAADGAAFVRLVLPKRDIYVGESVPVDIEVGLRDGFAKPNALPTLTGGDFTLNNLSHQPEQTPRVIDGKPYMVLTWHSVVAAVKPGKFSLSVEAPLTVRIRTRPQRDSMIDDMLGDPFLQNFFGASVTKEITATSMPSDLTVLELPVEGRPPDFSGAVGSFKIAGDLSSKTAAAGDPLTLRMHVTGSGNFDRVDSAMLEHLDQWKTYPPKSSFKASDALGLKGEKIFEQPLIASAPGPRTLPGLAFSYFDPNTHRYETARSVPLDVTISPSAADGSLNVNAPVPAGTAPSAGSTATAASNTGLRPDHAVTEAAAATLVPAYLQPRFLAIPSLLMLGFAGGWVGLRRRVYGPDDARGGRKRRASKGIDRVIRDMEAAARAGDAASFFALARTALESLPRTEHKTAPRIEGEAALRTESEAAPPAELDPVRLEDGLGWQKDDLRRFFALADEVNYAGLQPTQEEFERWIALLRHASQRSTLPPATGRARESAIEQLS